MENTRVYAERGEEMGTWGRISAWRAQKTCATRGTFGPTVQDHTSFYEFSIY